MKQYSSTNFVQATNTADLNEEVFARRLISIQKDLESIRTKLDKLEGPLCENARNMKTELSEKNMLKLFDEEFHHKKIKKVNNLKCKIFKIISIVN